MNGALEPLDSWFEENNWTPETPSTDAFLAEMCALEANTAKADIDMSDADCFTISRLHEIIYGSKLKWPEEKLLARFMHDVKQRQGE